MDVTAKEIVCTPEELKSDQGKATTELYRTTTSLRISNLGADDKSDIVISVRDSSGSYRGYRVVDVLRRGESATVDLAPFNIKVVYIKLRARGADGISRYIKPLEAAAGKYFLKLYCSWVAVEPGIEEHFFSGEESSL